MGALQRQRNVAISMLPFCSAEARAAFRPNDRQCRSAMVCAAAMSVSSEYQRNIIASGDVLTVQGGALQAARANVSAARRSVQLRGRTVTPLWLRMPMQILFIAWAWAVR